MRGKRLSAEEFVTAWMESHTIEEVVERTGMQRAAINQRIYGLRKKGVKLPRLSRLSRAIDVDGLNELIKRYEQKGEARD